MNEATVIVTVVGGVAEVASNKDDVSISIIDYDNLQDVVRAAPTGKDRSTISATDARYLMEYDAEFWEQLSKHVLVDYA